MIFTNEAELKEWFIIQIDNDFFWKAEVSGDVCFSQILKDYYHLSTTRIRADFLIYPKPHLLHVGFPPEYVAIEAKYIHRRAHRTMNRVYIQAARYAIAEYQLAKNLSIIPMFALVVTNHDQSEEKAWGIDALRTHAILHNVGRFSFNLHRPENNWAIVFGQYHARFFTREGHTFQAGNLRLGRGLYLGNALTKRTPTTGDHSS